MRFVSAIVFSLVALCAQAQGIEFFQGGFQEALEKARAEDRLLFVGLYAHWCAPCRFVDKKTYADSSVGEFFDRNFVSVRFDVEDDGDGTDLSRQYSVLAHPEFLFFSPEGRLAFRGSGMLEPEPFLEIAREALTVGVAYVRCADRYEAGDRSPEVLYGYARGLQKLGDTLCARVAREFLEAQKNWDDPQAVELIAEHFGRVGHPAFEHAVKHKLRFVEVLGADAYDDFVSSAVADTCIGLYGASGHLPEPEGKALFARYLPERGEEMFYHFRVLLYENFSDWENYAAAAIEYTDKFPGETSAIGYRNFAQNFCDYVEGRKRLERALEWALESIRLEKMYSNLETAAALYIKLGKKSSAKKYAKEAIEFGRAHGEDVSGAEELLENLGRK
jgi:thioredoxin-related protein